LIRVPGSGDTIPNSAGTCASPTATLATYAYDAQGRRKSKTVGATATVYVTDADNREVLEYNGSGGALNAWYAFGLGPDEALNRMNLAAASRQTLIPDIQGSILASLDSGGALAKTAYQPYGENPGLSSGSYQYTARRFDPETAGSAHEPSGIYYYRARMYSPTLGRFLQADPIGFQGGENLYAYVGNDPLNGIDPSGLVVVVTRNGNNIILSLPITFTGPNATSSNVASYISGIQSNWSGTFGKYTVTTVVVPPTAGSPFNTINVIPGPGNARSLISNFVPGTGGSTGIFFDPATTPWVAAHEAGHLMGLPDQYIEQPNPITGLAQSSPNPGYDTNIMAVRSGTPSEQDITNIVNGNSGSSGSGSAKSPSSLSANGQQSYDEFGLGGTAGGTESIPNSVSK
jgi:RHS repeat-associated protein